MGALVATAQVGATVVGMGFLLEKAQDQYLLDALGTWMCIPLDVWLKKQIEQSVAVPTIQSRKKSRL